MPKRTTPAVRSVNTTIPASRKSNFRSPSPLRSANPKMPHEQDQSVDMTDGAPSKTVQQAYRDVIGGQQDTDRGPVADSAYQKLKK